MGLNVDNLFIRGDIDRVAEMLGTLAAAPKWKLAISDIGGGWTQLIDSHEIMPPEFAATLSKELRTRVVCAQVYEVSGDVSLHVFEGGVAVESWRDDGGEDPAAEVQARVRAQGIDAPLLSFRETIQRSGWLMREKK